MLGTGRKTAAIALCLAAVVAAVIVVSAVASTATVTTGPAQSVNTSSATVTGTVNPNGESTTSSVQFGTTTGYGFQTSPRSMGSGTADQSVSVDLTGLRPGTTYHYRVIATNASGTTVGDDRTFATQGAPPQPSPAPLATTGGATAVGRSGATIHGTVTPRGSRTTHRFEFGVSPSYGLQSPSRSLSAGNSARSVSAKLSALQAGRQYHYRVVASNAGGVALGSDRTFTTSRAPIIRRMPGVTSKVTPRRDRRAPFKFKVRGKLIPPGGVSRTRGCRGRVTIRFKKGRKIVHVSSVRVRATCSYGVRARVKVRGRLRVSVRFGGNSALNSRSAPARKVRAG